MNETETQLQITENDVRLITNMRKLVTAEIIKNKF